MHRVRVPEADLARDGERSARIVAGDHDRAHAGPRALRHRLGHARAHRVVQAGEPDVVEVEVVLLRRQALVELEVRARHAEHPPAVGGGRLDLAVSAASRVASK